MIGSGQGKLPPHQLSHTGLFAGALVPPAFRSTTPECPVAAMRCGAESPGSAL